MLWLLFVVIVGVGVCLSPTVADAVSAVIAALLLLFLVLTLMSCA